jgi:hypothetical protein
MKKMKKLLKTGTIFILLTFLSVGPALCQNTKTEKNKKTLKTTLKKQHVKKSVKLKAIKTKKPLIKKSLSKKKMGKGKPGDDSRALISPRIIRFDRPYPLGSPPPDYYRCDPYHTPIRAHSGSALLGLRYVKIKFNGSEIEHIERPPGALYSNLVRFSLDGPPCPEKSGNYTLEAIVENTNGVTTAKSMIINVDAKDPRLRIVRPRDGQVFFTDDPAVAVNVVIRAAVTDDHSGIDRVRFSVHPGPEAIDDTPPYEVIIPCLIGDYNLDVRADDNAGNFENEIINFSVQERPL